MADQSQSTENNSGDSSILEPVVSGVLTSTVEFMEPENSETPPDGEGEGTDAAAGEGGDGKSKDKETFQDHPRFQELIQQKNDNLERAIKAEARLETLEKQQAEILKAVRTPQPNQQVPDKGLVDIFKMSDEQIIDAIEKNPKGFLANFGKQIQQSVIQTLTKTGQANQAQAQKQAQEKAIEQLYSKYEKENPDFVEMWEKGSIQEFMEKNPGHTPISAHKMIKLEGEKTAAVEKARKEEAEKLAKAARRGRRVILSGGPSGAPPNGTNSDADLKDTTKHGGLMRVLANRSLARSGGRE